jgi:hypothetical protein
MTRTLASIVALSVALVACFKNSDAGMSLTPQQHASGGDRNPRGQAASGATGAVAAKLSSVEAEARDAALAEIAKHLLKGPDGWTTVLTEGEEFHNPQHFLRQFREMTVERVGATGVSAAERLNGFDWIGIVSIRTGPCREVGDPGQAFSSLGMLYRTGIERPRGRWTQWVDVHPQPLDVSSVKGLWRVQPGRVDIRNGQPAKRDDSQVLASIFLQEDVSLLRGKLPTFEDFRRAGVK